MTGHLQIGKEDAELSEVQAAERGLVGSALLAGVGEVLTR